MPKNLHQPSKAGEEEEEEENGLKWLNQNIQADAKFWNLTLGLEFQEDSFPDLDLDYRLQIIRYIIYR